MSYEYYVIPAQAVVHIHGLWNMDPGLRRDDTIYW